MCVFSALALWVCLLSLLFYVFGVDFDSIQPMCADSFIGSRMEHLKTNCVTFETGQKNCRPLH